MKSYYVYTCKVDGVVRYVGKGKADRYKHCTSGKSTCAELNKALFDGSDLVVEMLHTGLSEDAALKLEAFEMQTYPYLYNKQAGLNAMKVVANPSISKDVEQLIDNTDFDIKMPFSLLRRKEVTVGGVSTELNNNLKTVWTYLESLIGLCSPHNVPCSVSHEYIAVNLNLSRRTVMRCIEKLIDGGILGKTLTINPDGKVGLNEYTWVLSSFSDFDDMK